MAGGTLDIGVVLQGFGVANEQLGILQNSLRSLAETHKQERNAQRLSAKGSLEYTDSVNRMKEATVDFSTTLVSNIAVALKQVTEALRDAGIQAENFRRQISAVGKTGEDAGKSLERLFEISQLPGLELEQTARAVTALRATKMSAQDAEETVIQFGNALASVGAGTYELQGTVTALSQIMSKGKVYAEEIYQIAERLPQTRVIMEEAFGTADTEVLAKEGLRSIDFIKAMNRGLSTLERVAPGTQESIKNLSNQFTNLRMNLAGQQVVFNKFTATLASGLGVINNLPKGLLEMSGSLIRLISLIAQATGIYLGLGAVMKAWNLLNGIDASITASKLPLMKLHNTYLWGQLYAEQALLKVQKAKLALSALTKPQMLAIAGAIVAVTAVIGAGIFAWKKWGKSTKTSKDLMEDFKGQAEKTRATLEILNQEKVGFSEIIKFKDTILEETKALSLLNDQLERQQDNLNKIKEGREAVDPVETAKIEEDIKLTTGKQEEAQGKVISSLNKFFSQVESQFTFDSSKEWTSLKGNLLAEVEDSSLEGRDLASDLKGVILNVYGKTAEFIGKEIEELEVLRDASVQERNKFTKQKGMKWRAIEIPRNLQGTVWAKKLEENLNKELETADGVFVLADQFKKVNNDFLTHTDRIVTTRLGVGFVSAENIQTVIKTLKKTSKTNNMVNGVAQELSVVQQDLVQGLIEEAKNWEGNRLIVKNIENIKVTSNEVTRINGDIESLRNYQDDLVVMMDGFTRYYQNIDNLRASIELSGKGFDKLTKGQRANLEDLEKTIRKRGVKQPFEDAEYINMQSTYEAENALRMSIVEGGLEGIDNLIEFIDLKRNDVLGIIFDDQSDSKSFFQKWTGDQNKAEKIIDELTKEQQQALRYGMAQQYIMNIAKRRSGENAIDPDLARQINTSLGALFKASGLFQGQTGDFTGVDLEAILEEQGLLITNEGMKELRFEPEKSVYREAKGTEWSQLLQGWAKGLQTLGLVEIKDLIEMDYPKLINNIDLLGESVAESILEGKETLDNLEATAVKKKYIEGLQLNINTLDTEISALEATSDNIGVKMATASLNIKKRYFELKIEQQDASKIMTEANRNEFKNLQSGTHHLQISLKNLALQANYEDQKSKIEIDIANRKNQIEKLDITDPNLDVNIAKRRITQLTALNTIDAQELKVIAQRIQVAKDRDAMSERLSKEALDERKEVFKNSSATLKTLEDQKSTTIQAQNKIVEIAYAEQRNAHEIANIDHQIWQTEQEQAKLNVKRNEETNKFTTLQEQNYDQMLGKRMEFLNAKKAYENALLESAKETSKSTDNQLMVADEDLKKAEKVYKTRKNESEFWELIALGDETIKYNQSLISQRHQMDKLFFQGDKTDLQRQTEEIDRQIEFAENRRRHWEKLVEDNQYGKKIMEGLDQVDEMVAFDQKKPGVTKKLTRENLADYLGVNPKEIQEVEKALGIIKEIDKLIGHGDDPKYLQPTLDRLKDLRVQYQLALSEDRKSDSLKIWQEMVKLFEHGNGLLGFQKKVVEETDGLEHNRNMTIKERQRLLERQNKRLKIQMSLLESFSKDPDMASKLDTSGVFKAMGFDKGIFDQMKNRNDTEREFLLAEQKMNAERQEMENERAFIESDQWEKEEADITKRNEKRKKALEDWSMDYLLLQTKHISEIINLNEKRRQALKDGYNDYEENMNDLADLRDRYALAQFDLDNARTGDTKRTQRQRKQMELDQKSNKIMREGSTALKQYMLENAGKENIFDLKSILEGGDPQDLANYQNMMEGLLKTMADSKELEAELAREGISKKNDLTKVQAQHNSRMEQMEDQHMDTMANIRIAGEAKIQNIIQGQSADAEARIKARNEAQIKDAENLEREKYNVQLQEEKSQHSQNMRRQKGDRTQDSYRVETDWFSNLVGSDVGGEAMEMFSKLNESIKTTDYDVGSRGGIEEMLMSNNFMDAQGQIDIQGIITQIAQGDKETAEKYNKIAQKSQKVVNKNLSPIALNTSATEKNNTLLGELISALKSFGANLIQNAGGVGEIANTVASTASQMSTDSRLQKQKATNDRFLGDDVRSNMGWAMRKTQDVSFHLDSHEVTTGVARSRRDGLAGKHWDGTGNEGQTARNRGDGAVNANVQGARGGRQAGYENPLMSQHKEKANTRHRKIAKEFLNQPVKQKDPNKPFKVGGRAVGGRGR